MGWRCNCVYIVEVYLTRNKLPVLNSKKMSSYTVIILIYCTGNPRLVSPVERPSTP